MALMNAASGMMLAVEAGSVVFFMAVFRILGRGIRGDFSGRFGRFGHFAVQGRFDAPEDRQDLAAFPFFTEGTVGSEPA